MRLFPPLALLFFGLTLVAGGDVQEVKSLPASDRIRPEIVVLPYAWATQLPPSGRVNAPEFLTTCYPKQRLAVGLLAEGEHRDRLLKNACGRVRVETGAHASVECPELKAATLRPLKAALLWPDGLQHL